MQVYVKLHKWIMSLGTIILDSHHCQDAINYLSYISLDKWCYAMGLESFTSLEPHFRSSDISLGFNVKGLFWIPKHFNEQNPCPPPPSPPPLDPPLLFIHLNHFWSKKERIGGMLVNILSMLQSQSNIAQPSIHWDHNRTRLPGKVTTLYHLHVFCKV